MDEEAVEASFIAKLTDAMAEAAETEDWLAYSCDCGYLQAEAAQALASECEVLCKSLNGMVLYSSSWCGKETAYKPQATRHKQQVTSE